MNTLTAAKLEPRIVQGKTMPIAGLREHYNTTMDGIPAQWQLFAPLIGTIKGRVGRAAYGLVSMSGKSGGIDYLTGVEVSELASLPDASLPDNFRQLTIPARRYAVFAHRDHVSTIQKTVHAIWKEWLPRSGHEHAGSSPDMIERYGEGFDPATGRSDIEIWWPIKG